jgi:hypothetical protein
VITEERFQPMLIAQSVKVVQQAIAASRTPASFSAAAPLASASAAAGQPMGKCAWQISPYSQHDHEVVVLKAVGATASRSPSALITIAIPPRWAPSKSAGDFAGFAQIELKIALASDRALPSGAVEATPTR